MRGTRLEVKKKPLAVSGYSIHTAYNYRKEPRKQPEWENHVWKLCEEKYDCKKIKKEENSAYGHTAQVVAATSASKIVDNCVL